MDAISYTAQTPLSFLERSARLWPGKVAVIYGSRRLSYAECLREVRGDAIWQQLGQHGVTHLNAAPTVVSTILNASAAGPLSRPVLITTAGAPPSPTTISEMERMGVSAAAAGTLRRWPQSPDGMTATGPWAWSSTACWTEPMPGPRPSGWPCRPSTTRSARAE
jgi:hypothetical protein